MCSFFFRQSPGLEASSCSARFVSICILRLSALLRVLTRDQIWNSPAYLLRRLASHICTGLWSSNTPLICTGRFRCHELERVGRSGRYSQRFKVALRAPATALWGSRRVWSRRRGCCWTELSWSERTHLSPRKVHVSTVLRPGCGLTLTESRRKNEVTQSQEVRWFLDCFYFQDWLLICHETSLCRQATS